MVQETDKAMSPLARRIADRVREFAQSKDVTPVELAKCLGVDQSHARRLLKGITPWRFHHLEKLAKLHDINLFAFFWVYMPVVHVKEPVFDYKEKMEEAIKRSSEEAVPMPPEDANPTEIYALKLQSDCCVPWFKSGDVLYVRRNAGAEIKDGDRVIFHDEHGKGHLKVMRRTEDVIILQDLSLSGPMLTRPQSYLSLLDKVIWVRFS